MRGDSCRWTHAKACKIRKVGPSEQTPNLLPTTSSPPVDPSQQPVIPATSLDVARYTVTFGHEDWEEKAFHIFAEGGFVLVEKVLKLHQCSSVLKDCEKAAKEIVGPARHGSRGKGRYSFGNTYSTKGLLHEH